MDEEKINYLYQRALCFLKFRPRSEGETSDYLKEIIEKKKWNDIDCQKVIATLKEQGLVDDKNFVDWFLQSRLSTKPKSQWLLKKELLRFGVEENLIDEYLSQLKINEEELVEKIIQTHPRIFANLTNKKNKLLAIAFLQRRGFSYGVIKKALKEICH
jgi:SOS response regulatory protein OraA/RecX